MQEAVRSSGEAHALVGLQPIDAGTHKQDMNWYEVAECVQPCERDVGEVARLQLWSTRRATREGTTKCNVRRDLRVAGRRGG